MVWVFLGVAALFLLLAAALRGNRSRSRDELGSDVIDYDYEARRGGGGFGGL